MLAVSTLGMYHQADAGFDVMITFVILFIFIGILCGAKGAGRKARAGTSTSRRAMLAIHDPNKARARRDGLTRNGDMERWLLHQIRASSEPEFAAFLATVEKEATLKFTLHGKHGLEHATFKHSLKRAIFKHTNRLPEPRVRAIERVFPLLRRVYFGPVVTRDVYATAKEKQKFRFALHTEIPRLKTIIDVALHFNTSVNVILGYCFSYNDTGFPRSKAARANPHYLHHEIPKRHGGTRLISEPKFHLKALQRKILADILEKAVLPAHCKGFVKDRSIADNAKPHVGAGTVVKMDFSQFFPSLSFRHVCQVFRGFGYVSPVAQILACLCTDWVEYPVIGNRYDRFVPQGAPTSPMISNLYATRVNRRLAGMWSKHGFRYTQYADDLTMSSLDPAARVERLIHNTYRIIRAEKLLPNKEKTRVIRKGDRMEVTGIVVNEKTNINRVWMNTLRGEVHRYALDGWPPGEEGFHEKQRVMGKISFLNMVRPDKAKAFIDALAKSPASPALPAPVGGSTQGVPRSPASPPSSPPSPSSPDDTGSPLLRRDRSRE